MFHMKHLIAPPETQPPICDYEGSSYRTEFWGGDQREYENLAERIALRALLPTGGQRLVEIGAGFGRLADLYKDHREVILLDYSKSILREAQARLGREPRYLYVAGNIYDLPLADQAVETLVLVRVIHHIQDVPRALAELVRVLAGGGALVMEYASKRHLKAIVRYLLHSQVWSPFDRRPYEFVPLNFNFHPAWMAARLRAAGLTIEEERAVSWFRSPALKRLVGANRLAALDRRLQPLGRWLKLTPSIFLRARAPARSAPKATGLFRCPICHSQALAPEPDGFTCQGCGRRWLLDDGIYDFKTPAQPA
jgi:SAM-dependent methyltransferase